jgi:hypothetical protein
LEVDGRLLAQETKRVVRNTADVDVGIVEFDLAELHALK